MDTTRKCNPNLLFKLAKLYSKKNNNYKYTGR